ncbi:Glycosyltransferase AglJ [Candidatus Gugararchaeum adminiculabundum]|nr:Glycosyltransferase AglJ [Candidatus Gugararchaeum adminiculabundum]
MAKKSVSIIIPALDEEKAIAQCLKSIPKSKIKKSYNLEVLVIDGCSKDRTAEIAGALGCAVIKEGRRGYGRACKTGLGLAKGDFIITLDADGSYPASKIPQLISLLDKGGLDFVTTNRFAKIEKGAMPTTNYIGNRILSLTSRILHSTNFEDSQSGMWAMRRSAWEKIRRSVKSDGFPFPQELKIEFCKSKAKYWEIPITYGQRKGKPKLHPWRDGFTNLSQLILKKFDS